MRSFKAKALKNPLWAMWAALMAGVTFGQYVPFPF